MSGITQAFGFIRAAVASFKSYLYTTSANLFMYPTTILVGAVTINKPSTITNTVVWQNQFLGATGKNLFAFYYESHDEGATWTAFPNAPTSAASIARSQFALSKDYVCYGLDILNASLYTLTIYVRDASTGTAIGSVVLKNQQAYSSGRWYVHYNKPRNSFLVSGIGAIFYELKIVNNVLQVTNFARASSGWDLLSFFISKDGNIIEYANQAPGNFTKKLREHKLDLGTYTDIPITGLGSYDSPAGEIIWCSINQKYILPVFNSGIKQSSDLSTWFMSPTWTTVGSISNVNNSRLYEDSDGKLYHITDTKDNSQKFPPTVAGCLFVSTDGGSTWKPPAVTYINITDLTNFTINLSKYA